MNRFDKVLNRKALAFDDVLVVPKFSFVRSRSEVNLSVDLGGLKLKLPVLSSPMECVSTVAMAKTANIAGAKACFDRFLSIQNSVNAYTQSQVDPIVSLGLNDFDRYAALKKAGAKYFLLDIAHGAQSAAADFVLKFRAQDPDSWLMVGNFATGNQVSNFIEYLGNNPKLVNAWRVGVGGGSACLTRIQTGHGLPTLESVLSVAEVVDNVVADGGIRNPGDVAKALAAGAKAVMIGGMLAGTDETPDYPQPYSTSSTRKLYIGSASSQAYLAQGKTQDYITYEGDSFEVPRKGPAMQVFKNIEGGLRSALSYSGVSTIQQYIDNSHLIEITGAGMLESKAHGKGI